MGYDIIMAASTIKIEEDTPETQLQSQLNNDENGDDVIDDVDNNIPELSQLSD